MRPAHSEENVALVKAIVLKKSQICRWVLCIELWKTLRKHLGLTTYKIQLVQELKTNDHRLRRSFAEWAQNPLEEGILSQN